MAVSSFNSSYSLILPCPEPVERASALHRPAAGVPGSDLRQSARALAVLFRPRGSQGVRTSGGVHRTGAGQAGAHCR